MPHPELHQEQAYVDAAYERLDEIRAQAKQRAAAWARESTRVPGHQYDRDVSVRVALYRAEQLDIGDESLVFGRTDAEDGQRLYVGRRNVHSQDNEPLVIDWRVPAAEPFYRATGAAPLGLKQRRHFIAEGRRLEDVEDEHFGDTDVGLAGTGALLAALERPRTGTMRDIAATIRAEQDRIIRAPLEGVLAVQGGPGTGKTAVALHRAAYLLFTYRRKLGRQDILVVGPNRLFLRYIDRVLPALGESGARLVMLEDLVDGVRNARRETGDAARIKGDARMVRVLQHAVRDRQGSGRKPITLNIEGLDVTLAANDVAAAVNKVRRGRRNHNAKHAALRRALAGAFYDAYVRAQTQRLGSIASVASTNRRALERAIRGDAALNRAVDEFWPLLTPKRFLADLLSSRAALRRAGRGMLTPADIDALFRERGDAWTDADIPLLDEAHLLLGAPLRDRRPHAEVDADDVETFGHVVADEIQDLTPMALRMLARRARSASMTIVGDLAQSVGPVPPITWDDILAHLPAHQGAHIAELTINYRTPGAIMDAAADILANAAPDLTPPTSVRAGGEPPVEEPGPPHEVIARLTREHRERGSGTMVVIAAPSQLDGAARAAKAEEHSIEETVSVLTVEEAKGLEFDEVVLVEPDAIVAESPQGLRALYVALTRATQHVRIAHAGPADPAD